MSSTPTQTQHRPGGIREMLGIALPMVVSSACDTIMTFTDRLMLSRVGPQHMAAAMAGGLTCFMMMTFFIGLIGYTTALAAQYLGAGRKDKCGAVAAQALIVALVGFPIIIAARPLAHALFDRMGIAQAQLEPQRIYFDILLWGSILGLLRNVFSAFFSGIGRTRIVMVAAMTAMLTNIAGNYALIYGRWGFPALGIAGAAYGTIFGSFCGLVILVAGYLAPSNRREFGVIRGLRYDSRIMGRLLRFGFPGGIELFLNVLAFDVLILTFHSVGLAAATATTVVFNWDMVQFVPMIGVNIAVTSLVGRYMGARQPDIAERATYSGLKLAWGYAFCSMAAFFFLPHLLVGVFRPVDDGGLFAQAEPLAITMLRLASLYVLADATNLIFSGALRGAGDTLWAMIISVGLHYVLVVMLVFMLRVLETPVVYAWMVLCVTILVFSGVFYGRFRSGKWRNIRVIPGKDDTRPLVTDGLHEVADL